MGKPGGAFTYLLPQGKVKVKVTLRRQPFDMASGSGQLSRSRSRYLIYCYRLSNFCHLSLHYRHHTYPFGPKENFAYRNQTKSKRTDMLRPSLKFILRQSVPGLRPAIGTPRSISVVGSGRRQGRFKALYLLIVCCG